MTDYRLKSLFCLLPALALVVPSAQADDDLDGVGNHIDNCLTVANADQRDTDDDGFGNICDPDLDQSGQVNFGDLAAFKSVFLSNDPDANFDGLGSVNFGDLAILKSFFLQAPGPAGPFSSVNYTDDAQPIFAAKCLPCHTTLGLGGHNIATNYNDAFQAADNSDCDGLTIGECTIVRILSGEMPQGADCSGDPSVDAGNAACLTQLEQDTIQAWIDRGLPE